MRAAITALATILALTACTSLKQQPVETAKSAYSAAEVKTETDRINAWFEAKFEEQLNFSPIQKTFLGRDSDQDKIDDFSLEAAAKELAWQKASVEEMKASFTYDKLSPEAKTSYDIWNYLYEQAVAEDKFRGNTYYFEQMNAIHTFFPQLLISFQKVSEAKDMDNYLARIPENARALNQLIDLSQDVAKNGVRPPYFAFDFVIAESTKIISGAPFDKSKKDSDIWADAKGKIAELEKAGKIDKAKANQLRKDIKAALLKDWKAAYQRLIAWQKQDRKNAPKEAQGVSALPNGAAYYNERLANQTTTSLTADEIHELGLSEVARLRTEMEAVKDKFGFNGTLKEFFSFLRDTKDDPRLYFPDTDAGRQAYLDGATAAIDRIKAQLPNYFGILPKADLVVKRVEPFREQPGAAQHYVQGTPDGSRPGTYYVHLSDMKAVGKNELEDIAYHEGLPGHHMQISIAQELKGVPTFRTQAGFTAYIEGWALYSELLAKEMPGTYADPLSDFGRLANESWRAIRLVVDTGMHAKGWSEQKAVDYFLDNAPSPETQARSEVRRYLTIPGQATSYKIGMIKIQALRKKAETELGPKFDIRAFHDTVLGGGALPLDLLERRVNDWIDSVKVANAPAK